MVLEKDVLMYRSYLALRKYRVVLDDIKPSSPELLHPLRQLAQFLSTPSERDNIVADLDTKVFLIYIMFRGVYSAWDPRLRGGEKKKKKSGLGEKKSKN